MNISAAVIVTTVLLIVLFIIACSWFLMEPTKKDENLVLGAIKALYPNTSHPHLYDYVNTYCKRKMSFAYLFVVTNQLKKNGRIESFEGRIDGVQHIFWRPL